MQYKQQNVISIHAFMLNNEEIIYKTVFFLKQRDCRLYKFIVSDSCVENEAY